ncbi:zinc-binding dehydrogenase [Streptomyces sp. NPDC102278]|uniref:zinc-binding dehydrogenase n=1 Tax=Streptomyces sp. NPDC102278 TaxID=3366152 RepID=UPI00380EE7DE
MPSPRRRLHHAGVFVGGRARFEEMNRAVSAHALRPVIGRVHSFDEVHTAYRGHASNAPFGRVVIRVSN